MTADSDDRPSELKQSLQFNIIQVSLGFFLLLAVPILFVSLAHHFYFGSDWIASLSFSANDRPAWAPINESSQIFGLHYFGDYLLPNYWSGLENPWTSGIPITYPPLALEFFKVYDFLPYKSGLLTYLGMMLIANLLMLAFSVRRLRWMLMVQVSVVFGFLSGPLIASLDRGNFVGFLPPLYFAFAIAVLSKKWNLAALLVAFLTAVKIYPLVLFAVFLVYKKWRPLAFGLVATSVLFLLPLAFLEGSMRLKITGLWNGFAFFRGTEPDALYCGNISFIGGYLNSAIAINSEFLPLFIQSNLTKIIFILILFTIWCMVYFREVTWITILLGISMTTFVAPIQYVYSLSWAVSSLAIVFYVSGRRNSAFLIKGLDTDAAETINHLKFENFALYLSAIYSSILIAPYPFLVSYPSEIGCKTSVLSIVYSVATVTWLSLLIGAKVKLSTNSTKGFQGKT
jgi:hypothetical protein